MANYYYGKSNRLDLKIKIPEENCFIEKEEEFYYFNNMKEKVLSGDVIYLENINVLGKQIDNIVIHWKQIIEECKADIVLCDYLDIDTRKFKYTGSEFLISILEYLVLRDRESKENWRKLQAEGFQRARESGVVIGRPKRIKQETFNEVYEKLSSKGLPDHSIKKMMKFPNSTFYRYKSKMKNEKK